MYSGHLQGAKVRDFAGNWRVFCILPGEVHEVEGQIVGLREGVEVNVVVAKQIVATERAQSGHPSLSLFYQESLNNFVKLETSITTS